jgi:hypothetical protein
LRTIFDKDNQRECEYKVDYMDAFATIGDPWPPTEERLASVFTEKDSHLLSLVTRREMECVFWGCKKHPQLPDGASTEWMDVNRSLPQHAGPEFLRRPFMLERPGTLIGTTKLVLREFSTDDSRGYVLRLISGMESLAMMGFDRRALVDHTVASDNLQADLAGNAFSAFAFGPLPLAALPTLAYTREHMGLKPMIEVPSSSESEESSSSD